MNKSEGYANCQTSLTQRIILSEHHSLAVAYLLALLSPVIAIANFLLCFALIKTRQVKIVSQRFVFILGLSDFCVGSLACPLLAVLFSFLRQSQACLYEKLTLFYCHFNTRLTAYVVFLIGIDRYSNINTEFRTRTCLSKVTQSSQGLFILFFSVLTTSAVLSALTIIDFENRNLPKIASSSVDATIYFLYLFIYIRLYYKIRKFTRKNSIHIASGTARPRYIGNLIRTVLYLLLSVGICYLPYVIVSFIVTYTQQRLKQPVSQTVRFAQYMTIIPIVLNSLLNTIIILNRNRVLKRYILAKVLRIKSHNATQTTVMLSRPGFANEREDTQTGHIASVDNGNRNKCLDDQTVHRQFRVVAARRKSRVRFKFGNNSILPNDCDSIKHVGT